LRSEINHGETKLASCDYIIERKLSRGYFGEVFIASNIHTNELFALKKISKKSSSFQKRFVAREIRAGNLLKHQNIVEFFHWFQTENNIYFIFELLEEDLHTWMVKRNFQPVIEENILDILAPIFNGCVYIHSQKIAHRDIKWSNIINKKILDFGLCTDQMEEDELCYDFVGSRNFAAPEILDCIPYSGFKADVFSCGMILFGLVFGTLVVNRIENSILWPDRTIPGFPNFVSRCVKDLMTKMLDIDPKSRITMKEVCDHKWMKSFCRI